MRIREEKKMEESPNTSLDMKPCESGAIQQEYTQLVQFVKAHVIKTLRKLYKDITEEEKRMKNDIYMEQDLRKTMQSMLRLLNSEKEIRIYGPVGERPLHVFSLSAHRFDGIDFSGKGNYVQEGILSGMMHFIDNYDRNEIYAEYGKDYCALLGSCLQECFQSNTVSCIKDSPKPPFWDDAKRWNKKYGTDKSCCFWKRYPTFEMEQSVTVGLYEGETIVFPMIAAGDRKILHWILNIEKKIQELEGEKR